MVSKALSGGDALTKKLAELSAQITKASEVRIGFLEGSTEPDGTPTPQIAAIQEFGTTNTRKKTVIPPRPFFRTMIAEKSGQWGNQLGEVLKHNDFDAAKSLALMGMGIGGQLQDSIIAVVAPPLSPITLMLRKMRSENQALVMGGKTVAEAARRVAAGESPGDVSTKPLVDSGSLLNSVSYQVDEGEKVEVDPNRTQE